MEGAKYEKAQEWRIPIVNVQWLSDLVLGNYETIRNFNSQRYQMYDQIDPFKIDRYGQTNLMGELSLFNVVSYQDLICLSLIATAKLTLWVSSFITGSYLSLIDVIRLV